MNINEIAESIEKKASGKFVFDKAKSIIFVDPDNWILLATFLKNDSKKKRTVGWHKFLICVPWTPRCWGLLCEQISLNCTDGKYAN